MPWNRLVNEAVGEYLDTRSATVEAELKQTPRRVKAYRVLGKPGLAWQAAEQRSLKSEGLSSVLPCRQRLPIRRRVSDRAVRSVCDHFEKILQLRVQKFEAAGAA